MNTLKRIIIIIIYIIIPAFSAYAAEILNLQDAISISLKNNNKYLIAQEKTSESGLKVREAWGGLWPNISTEASLTRQGAQQGIQSLEDGDYDLRFVKCSVAINPGNLYNSIMAAKQGRIISVNDERRIKAEISINTIRLFYKILLTDEIIKLRTNSIKALEENLKVISTGYNTGSFTRLDFLRAKVAVANEKTRLINARNDCESARASLNIHLGREIDIPLELNNDVIRADTREEEKFAGLSDEQRKDLHDRMLTESFKNRPEIIQIKSRKEAQEYGAKANESMYLWPTIFAAGSYGTTKLLTKSAGGSTGDPSADIALTVLGKMLTPEGWNRNWSITVGGVYKWGTLSPLDPSYSRAAELRSQGKQTDLEMEDFLKQVNLEIQQGLLKISSASNAILSQKENIESAEEAFRVAAVQFKNGVIDNTKFLDSNVELAAAKSMYIQAIYDFQTSKAELNRIIGYEYFSF